MGAEDAPAMGDTVQDLARLTARLGHAMIASGESVAGAHAVLHRIAAAHGIDDCSFYTLPTGSIAVLRSQGRTAFEMATEGGLSVRLDQVRGIYKLAADAQRAESEPSEALRRLEAVMSAPPCYHPLVVIAGHGIATFGFAMILQLSWATTAVAVGLGLVAGALRLEGSRVRRVEVMRPVVVSFVCGLAVFLLARQGLVDAPYRALIPPLLLSLPFVPMTLATLELADKQIVSGASRLAYATVQVVLLVAGLLAAQELVGLSPAVAVATPPAAMGWWAPWVGTLLFAIGVALHLAAPWQSLPWLIAVSFAARVGLVLGDLIGSPYIAAILGAVCMAFVADWSSSYSFGPPRLITFSPTFILLIPGALALTGLTQVFGPDHVIGFDDLAQAMFILVAIAVGLMLGVGLYASGCKLLGRPAPPI